MLADENARRACMVEMNVRKEEVAQVLKLEPTMVQGAVQAIEAGRRTAVEERGPVVGLDQVGANDALRPLMVEIERIRAH
jgi:hypothetical protein